MRILKDSKLLEGLPSPFTVMRYHSLVAEGLPEVLEALAETEDGLLMACQHKMRPLYGVQFHPESIGTPEGTTLLRNFLRL